MTPTPTLHRPLQVGGPVSATAALLRCRICGEDAVGDDAFVAICADCARCSAETSGDEQGAPPLPPANCSARPRSAPRAPPPSVSPPRDRTRAASTERAAALRRYTARRVAAIRNRAQRIRRDARVHRVVNYWANPRIDQTVYRSASPPLPRSDSRRIRSRYEVDAPDATHLYAARSGYWRPCILESAPPVRGRAFVTFCRCHRRVLVRVIRVIRYVDALCDEPHDRDQASG